jgi:hypothetical protein
MTWFLNGPRAWWARGWLAVTSRGHAVETEVPVDISGSASISAAGWLWAPVYHCDGSSVTWVGYVSGSSQTEGRLRLQLRLQRPCQASAVRAAVGPAATQELIALLSATEETRVLEEGLRAAVAKVVALLPDALANLDAQQVQLLKKPLLESLSEALNRRSSELEEGLSTVVRDVVATMAEPDLFNPIAERLRHNLQPLGGEILQEVSRKISSWEAFKLMVQFLVDRETTTEQLAADMGQLLLQAAQRRSEQLRQAVTESLVQLVRERSWREALERHLRERLQDDAARWSQLVKEILSEAAASPAVQAGVAHWLTESLRTEFGERILEVLRLEVEGAARGVLVDSEGRLRSSAAYALRISLLRPWLPRVLLICQPNCPAARVGT